MIIDRFNRFSNDQAVCNAAATEVSEDVVDLLAAGDAIGRERYLHVLVTEAFAGTGTTCTFVLETDDNEAMASAADIYTSAAIAKATLVPGYKAVRVRIPKGCERYLRLSCEGDDTFETTGKITAWLGDAGDANDFTA